MENVRTLYCNVTEMMSEMVTKQLVQALVETRENWMAFSNYKAILVGLLEGKEGY